ALRRFDPRDTAGVAEAQYVLGHALSLIGDMPGARDLSDAALAAFRALGDRWAGPAPPPARPARPPPSAARGGGRPRARAGGPWGGRVRRCSRSWATGGGGRGPPGCARPMPRFSATTRPPPASCAKGWKRPRSWACPPWRPI